jgi:hypothetical protein
MATPLGKLFTIETVSIDYTLEVIQFLDDIQTISLLNKFCKQLMQEKGVDIWKRIAARNMISQKFILREVIQWTTRTAS